MQSVSTPMPHTYISTYICILAQINTATALQANLFTVLTHRALVSIEEQFQMRLIWKMFFNRQSECDL